MRGRWIYGVCGILLLTGLYSCARQTPLIWDGAYQFYYTVVRQQPYYYGTRLHSWLLWHPVAWLSHFTSNLRVLTVLYGLPFAMAPAVSLALSWWIVRDRDRSLIVWAVLGIAAAPLPGQIFIINDSIFQQHLFWPVFLALLVPLTRPQKIVVVLLALFQLSHPIGAVLLLIGAAAAGCLALADRARRPEAIVWFVFLSALVLLSILKLWCFPDDQAAGEFHFFIAQNRWRKGVAGAPLAGLAFLWAAGALLCLRQLWDAHARTAFAPWLGRAAVICAVVGGAIWMNWATDEHDWAFALDYRRWLVPLTLPFFLMAAFEGIVPSRRRPQVSLPADENFLSPRLSYFGEDSRRFIAGPLAWGSSVDRARVVWVVAATFAAVLVTQSVLWAMLSRRLMDEVNADARLAVPGSSMPWIEHTPLQHWGTVTYLSILQGRAPAKVFLLESSDVALLRNEPPLVPLAPWDHSPPTPGIGGWFDYRPMIHAMREAHD